MIRIGNQYGLGNLHALPWASICLFQNGMTGLLFLISFLPVTFADALPLHLFHLNLLILKHVKCVYKVL